MRWFIIILLFIIGGLLGFNHVSAKNNLNYVNNLSIVYPGVVVDDPSKFELYTGPSGFNGGYGIELTRNLKNGYTLNTSVIEVWGYRDGNSPVNVYVGYRMKVYLPKGCYKVHVDVFEEWRSYSGRNQEYIKIDDVYIHYGSVVPGTGRAYEWVNIDKVVCFDNDVNYVYVGVVFNNLWRGYIAFGFTNFTIGVNKVLKEGFVV